jgi:phosphoribosylaminoimidazolecarboxamide formyltransferase/IMP cyclohydrolase
VDDRRPIRRALVSVSDKAGLVDLAVALHSRGVQIVSTGSTAATIRDAGIPVVAVSDVTGFPECLDGRVKTLHPSIHAGLLADVTREDHAEQLVALGIAPFDLVVVNLYPFTATVASGASIDDCIEQIDIGGPAMVRASAKNHACVSVIVDPQRYADVVAALDHGGFTAAQRRELATAAFVHTATYDTAVAAWMSGISGEDAESQPPAFPSWFGAAFTRTHHLRYGENPHQSAAVYAGPESGGIAAAEQLHGREMSYNNYVDADAALRAAHDHAEPAVAIIKHANPCGLAIGTDIADAYRKALATDPVSAFGGVVAANRPVTLDLVDSIGDVFTEVIVAPAFEADALAQLRERKNLRILIAAPTGSSREWRAISGGLLIQEPDAIQAPGDSPDAWDRVCGPAVDDATLRDLVFAWRAVRAVKSNAILLARDGAAVGVGMGQVNRVDSARLAVARAGVDRARGSVAASDAFFPFADGLQVLIDAGVRAVVQPGGSVRDPEVVAAAAAAGVTMFFTATRHFAH